MRRRSLNQAGLTVLGLLIGFLIVAGLVGGGYFIYNSGHKKALPTSSNQNNQAVTTPPVPAVGSSSNLSNVISSLNQVNPAADSISDTSQLSSQSSF